MKIIRKPPEVERVSSDRWKRAIQRRRMSHYDCIEPTVSRIELELEVVDGKPCGPPSLDYGAKCETGTV